MATTTVTAGDGQVIGCELWETPGATSTVVFLPALGVPLGYYRKLLGAWAATGVNVVGAELRGMPASPATADFGYTDLIHRDLPAVFGLAPVRDAGRVILAGHSLGGVLALLATGVKAVEPDAVVTVATAAVWHRATGGGALARARRWAVVRSVGLITAALGYWPGHRLGFGGRQRPGVMRDWAYEGRHGRYRLHGDDADYERGLSSIGVPVLMLGIEGDKWFDRTAIAALAARIPTATQVQVPGTAGAGHVDWARRVPGEVLDTICHAGPGYGVLSA